MTDFILGLLWSWLASAHLYAKVGVALGAYNSVLSLHTWVTPYYWPDPLRAPGEAVTGVLRRGTLGNRLLGKFRCYALVFTDHVISQGLNVRWKGGFPIRPCITWASVSRYFTFTKKTIIRPWYKAWLGIIRAVLSPIWRRNTRPILFLRRRALTVLLCAPTVGDFPRKI